MTERLMVVDLRSTAAAFALPERVRDSLRAVTPRDWRIHISDTETDSFGDGAQAPSPEVLGVIGDAEAYVGFGMPRALFLAGKRLKWVQTGTAGVATLLFDEMKQGDVLLTNAPWSTCRARTHRPARRHARNRDRYGSDCDRRMRPRIRRAWYALPEVVAGAAIRRRPESVQT
jgi:hypothetical protein